MHLYGRRVFERQDEDVCASRGTATSRLRAAAAVLLTLTAGVPSGYAQEAPLAPPQTKSSSGLPAAPEPTPTEPLSLRETKRDFSQPAGKMLGNPLNLYRPSQVPAASFANSVRLQDLVKNGKIYLSLSDAIALAIENNYDIAIARYNLDIADTDILRTKAGAITRGVNSGIVAGTQGSSGSALTGGGGPGGTSASSGGGTTGAGGFVATTIGAGPMPENQDPSVTGTIQLERAKQPSTNTLFSGGRTSVSTNTDQYNFAYNQGFVTGSSLQVAFNNQRQTTDNGLYSYSPTLTSSFKATVTQHLLQGFGIYVNRRFYYEALNNRRSTDASFRQQILYTTNQVENIYWGLVSAYEAVQAKERALAQSTQLESDTNKQLEIGTMAPLDLVNAKSNVASDQQALISAQSTLKYQQLVLKQAIARNLNDPALVAADVIPTDRISLEELPEEKQPVDDLVQAAFKQRPELEQAVLALKNSEIAIHGAKNGLLPTLDAYGFYGANAVGGSQNPNCLNFQTGGTCKPGTFPSVGYGNVLENLGNSTGPDKGVGFSLTIPIRNRPAQADQARALLEYRQNELRLEQLHTQIRMQVVNAQFALTNDRAQVLASRAAHDYATQSLDSEQKKLRLGASTTANVLQQERNLATAESNLIAAEAAYAKDRAGLYNTLATTLQQYGINLGDAATGAVGAAPAIPGLQPAKDTRVAPTAPPPTQQ